MGVGASVQILASVQIRASVQILAGFTKFMNDRSSTAKMRLMTKGFASIARTLSKLDLANS